MKSIRHIFLISCLKATELIEKNLHLKLSLSERLKLKVHKSMCKACALYDKQSAMIEKGISAQIRKEGMKTDIEGLKNKIHQILESK
jgi:DNA transposition AAA+ family ATPase